MEAEYCGVKPENIKKSKQRNGIKKNKKVIIVDFFSGESFHGIGLRFSKLE